MDIITLKCHKIFVVRESVINQLFYLFFPMDTAVDNSIDFMEGQASTSLVINNQRQNKSSVLQTYTMTLQTSSVVFAF